MTSDPTSAGANLQRFDLTEEQRDQHIRRYAELLERQRQWRQDVAIESRCDDGMLRFNPAGENNVGQHDTADI